MKEALLQVKGLSFGYRPGMPVFHDVSLSLCAGDILSILGPNGAGKSTLLNCIVSLLAAQAGEILIRGKPLQTYSPGRLAREVAYVPQVHVSGLRYQVRDYVVMGRAPHIGALRNPDREDYKKADEAIERMRIAHLANKSFHELSGGERQQAQIARALVQDARLILMDEPTNHLDYGNQLKILHIISDLAGEGYAVLLTTHMPDHAILLDGYTGILQEDGQMHVGEGKRVLTEQNLSALYQTELRMIYVEELGRQICVAGKLRGGSGI